MIGLMISAPPRAASANWSADQSPHSPSSVTTSRSTLLSTSVAPTSPSRQFHDLVGREAARAPAAHELEEGTAAMRPARRSRLLHPYRVAVDLELHLGIWQQTEFLPDFLWNRDLTLGRHPHSITPTSKSNTNP